MNTESDTGTVRYYIDSNGKHVVKKYYAAPWPAYETPALDIPYNEGKPIFVDILEKQEFVYKVKMFFINGDVVVGYIAHRPFDPIKISNQHLLLDGRYNS